jgi:predicted enzyme related to lactoylglutathione lyase
MKIAMVSLFVNSPVEAHKFYTEVLGFTSKLFMPEMYLAIVVSPEEPNATGLLLEPNNNPIAKTYQDALRKESLPSITFGTTDIQQEYERLKAKGVSFTQEPTKTDWGFEAVFDDTCGNFIQLAQV